MKLLLDADMLAFRACAATEVEVQLSDDVWTRHSQLDVAREWYWDHISRWIKDFDCDWDDVLHCFSDSRTGFRLEMYPQYKHNRKKPKPIGYGAFRSHVLQAGNSFFYQRIEADDVIGLLASKLHTIGENYVVLSGDKDLKQIHGHHTWIDRDLELVSTEQAQRAFWMQALTGDSTDGIPGCAGVGPVKAERIVKAFDFEDDLGCWEAVVSEYRKTRGLEQPEEFALMQARLVRILRDDEYDFSSNKVSLWNPPTLSSASSAAS